MDWGQFAILFITFAGIFFWNRTESRADIRHMDAKLESNKNLSLEIHKENKEMVQEILKGIQAEIKDFHGRLCSIEERNRDRK